MPAVTVVHVVVGPAEHGVVRHGGLVAAACGHPVVRVERVDDAVLPPCEVVHAGFTDRLFGADVDAAAAAVERLAARAAEAGAVLSLTLHDVPHDHSPLQVARRAGYARVIAAARGVVVNSDVELALVQDLAPDVHSLRRIPLPVEAASQPRPGSSVPDGTSVTVLGFVFPDRGYEQVIDALPPGARLVALGRASAGHDDLVDRYRRRADGRFRLTGFVAEAELPAHLAAAAVPVAPNPRVTASASINTWLAHGRRPLVPESPYGREIAGRFPGCVTLYTPDGLAAALRDALADPGSTRLPRPVSSDVDAVAAAYADHLDTCRPDRLHGTDSAPVAPGNRWDLVPHVDRTARVSVVVPYFDDQRRLDLVLAALAAQTHPADRLELVVADDGSPVAPDLRAARPLRTTTVRQDDQGFRAAAARNLGAAAATGQVLVFLDADTVPEPDFVARLTALPAACPDVVTVGRRRHTVFGDALPPGEWWCAVDPLAEPAWLRDEYTRTGDLLRSDRRSYRHVISAVFAVDAALFAAVGGFDERFVGYGGEDWELAHRLWVAGALLAHVPDAVAWHDGPDWAERADPVTRAAQKRHETARLSVLLPDPDARGAGRWWPYPSVVVRAGRMTGVDALATTRSAFAAGVDCAFWFDSVDGDLAPLVLADPGVSLGEPAADVLARAWCQVELHGPADLAGLMSAAELADRHGLVERGDLTARSARLVHRAARHGLDPALLAGRQDRTVSRS